MQFDTHMFPMPQKSIFWLSFRVDNAMFVIVFCNKQ